MPGNQGILSFPDDATPAPPTKPWSVSRLNREVRDCLESRLGSVWVEGEISNLRRQPSGHQYFSLKDESAQVSCVLFRSAATASVIRDGMQVEIFGDISVYEPRGQYQIVVRRIQPRGAGELEAKLRALQERLRAEGLFEQARKKTLPPHPVRVGVVTSPAGAAIRDFLHVLRRRAPHIEVFIAPVRVQGRGAAAGIAAAVTKFSEPARSGFPSVDVVVVTRGGGSLEDLWEFNEEVVARAIAASAVPVISAVGHEIDTTTSDLVADVRAPTPSAAAEILSADRAEALDRLRAMHQRLKRAASVHVDRARATLELRASAGVFREPLRRIIDWRQLVDDLSATSSDIVAGRLSALTAAAHRAGDVLRARSPRARIAAGQSQLQQIVHRQTRAAATSLDRHRQRHARHAHALELLGPRQTLARGFTITMDLRRRPVTSARQAAAEPEIVTMFADGEIVSRPQPEKS
jgi:exodeoxyribonuclease VII large subunit